MFMLQTLFLFQLCLSVHRHRSIECDRGCEGNDSNSSDDEDENETTETESGESSWEFGSLSGPFSSNTGVDLRFESIVGQRMTIESLHLAYAKHKELHSRLECA